MKKVNALVLGLAVLLMVGCGGDEPEPNNNQNPNEQIFNSCRVKKLTYNGNTEYNHTYNSQGQLVTVHVAGVLVETFEYNSLGKVSRHIILRSGTDTTTINTFEHNGDSLITKVTSRHRFNPAEPFITTSISDILYDAQKRRTQVLSQTFDQATVQKAKSDYTYLGTNKVKIDGFTLDPQSNSWHLTAETEFTYDNQKRPNYGNNELFGSEINHNVISISNKHYSSGIIMSTSTTAINYTFNPSGYPIESIRITPGQSAIAYKYEYDCQ